MADFEQVSPVIEVLVSATLEASNGRVTGWVGDPGFRGTWDIVWTSVATIFICTFTLLCLNVPAKQDTFYVLFGRRVLWMLLAIVAPEIVLTYAAGQWSRARHSLDDFHASGYSQWTMRMAFFADMGGFLLDARDSVPFPLNAKQLHWLVVNNHVQYPDTDVDEIWDKSKQDRFARFITTFQVGYTILHAIGRAGQGLAITTLELNTLGIVVCSLMTAFAWLHKPADVRTPIRITMVASIADITGGRPWRTTPLDFIDENGPGWAINVQPFMRMPVIPPDRPIQRIPNDRFPMNPYGIQEYCLCFATLLFTAIHVAGWHFSFPTTAEKVLWRVSSLILFGVTAAFWILETAASWKDEKLRDQPTREPAELPLAWEFWTIGSVAFLYGVARLYMIAEAFLELRDLDATAYINVNWSMYIPHV
ncbi:hypothetical protein C8A01DRAFT_48866 [Parachaetomium inaequale]|uniref:Uncharacterized protein n=1 Tax=Parachaetomium inaequale TaxID=2588326 RepID=A0AAN6PDM6_9PEZI|nr:hypothetical protein C8A01DRAFT_48866 [Parachaetomium inaequale]